MTARGYFITGTDTGCGKTEVTLALMHLLQQQGHSVLGMKPVASGCEQVEGKLRNEDAVRIQARASRFLAYELVNPYAFEPAIAPHLAAQQQGTEIDIDRIGRAYLELAEQGDWVLVEGVGGWQVPLNGSSSLEDLALHLSLPVVMVVGIRLGCLNHALLTAEAIAACGLRLSGWVANRIDPQMEAVGGNLLTLEERIPAPLLGVVPFIPQAKTEQLAGYLKPHW